MSVNNFKIEPTLDRNLSLAIEPLANYICAADQPRQALRSALTALFNEVIETNKAAQLHFSRRRGDSLGLAL